MALIITPKDEEIAVNVNQAVEDFYPLLDKTQASLIAEYVNQRFDYSVIYDTIQDLIDEYCDKNSISLEEYTE